MAVPLSSSIRVAPDVMFRLVGEEGVLVNLNTERYLGLNAVGARMWTLVGNVGSLQDAYDQLLQEYDVDPSRLRADFDEFIDQLVSEQLIEAQTEEHTPRQG